jgi:hypothetical protein
MKLLCCRFFFVKLPHHSQQTSSSLVRQGLVGFGPLCFTFDLQPKPHSVFWCSAKLRDSESQFCSDVVTVPVGRVQQSRINQKIPVSVCECGSLRRPAPSVPPVKGLSVPRVASGQVWTTQDVILHHDLSGYRVRVSASALLWVFRRWAFA